LDVLSLLKCVGDFAFAQLTWTREAAYQPRGELLLDWRSGGRRARPFSISRAELSQER
jgi:hypothetical protein